MAGPIISIGTGISGSFSGYIQRVDLSHSGGGLLSLYVAKHTDLLRLQVQIRLDISVLFQYLQLGKHCVCRVL
jgi:hypothetical protein